MVGPYIDLSNDMLDKLHSPFLFAQSLSWFAAHAPAGRVVVPCIMIGQLRAWV